MNSHNSFTCTASLQTLDNIALCVCSGSTDQKSNDRKEKIFHNVRIKNKSTEKQKCTLKERLFLLPCIKYKTLKLFCQII